MNILYLHAHDLGRFCEPYGHAIPSPNIQRLAEEGVLFRQAFCAAPSCSPSRAALVTGRWPHCNGMFGLASPSSGWTLNDYRQHIASFLGRHGFDTALAGTQHEARAPFHDPREIGYRRMFNYRPEEPTRDAKCSEICAAAQAFLAEPHDRPFFLSVGFIEPHRANQGDRRVFSKEIPAEPPDIDGRYCAPLPHLPDNPVTRRETANFKQGVAMLDRQFGAVLKALEDNNLADDTLVICTTDHGPGFPEMKCTLTDRGTGVTLIVRGPRGFRGGRSSMRWRRKWICFRRYANCLGWRGRIGCRANR